MALEANKDEGSHNEVINYARIRPVLMVFLTVYKKVKLSP
jgi:hypothetical protein